MIRKLANILTIILSATALLACDQVFLGDDNTTLDGEYSVMMSGLVSEIGGGNNPIAGIRITFSAFEENSISVMPVVTKTVYTDGNGVYSVEAGGFSEAIRCTITASSTAQNSVQYEEQSQEILVTWNGDSFDPETSTFFVNNCNFLLKKK